VERRPVDGTGRLSRREQYARQTRAAVIESAHRLFLERGYAATSLRAIADSANVSEQTVYRVFGDKAELLRAVLLAAVGVEGAATNLQGGQLLAAVAAAASPSDRLRLVARVMHDSYERGLAQLEAIVVSAASADERVAELAREMAVTKYQDVRSLVVAIVGDAELDGLGIDDVVDYVYAAESSPVYLTLTAERGWTTEKYVEWFVDMFERMFLSRIRGRTRGARR
jgi:AcrR family transcriptional regulator